MFFHFVKKGDNLYDISKKYNISIAKLIEDNSLLDPENLVINQCLLIDLEDFNHIVKEGDSLKSISNKYHISENKIKEENDIGNEISPGEILKIRYSTSKKERKWINGYCYNESSLEAIKKALPSLTSLSIFSYLVKEDGSLSSSDDERIINLALEYGVDPIMVITNSKEKGGFSPSLSKAILTNAEVSNTLIENVISTMKRKKYRGLNVDFEYVNPEEKEEYVSFLNKIKNILHENDFYLTVALAPKYNENQKGLLYEAHDYKAIGQIADLVIIMTYEWGYTYGPSMPVSPYDEVNKVINYTIKDIPPKKILMGLPNYGYDFILPYKEKQKAKSIRNNQAIPIAFKNKTDISYSKTTRTPSFKYTIDSTTHEVQYDNPYSIYEKLTIIDDYSLRGCSIWTIGSCCKFFYILIENSFKIEKNPN